MFGPMTVDHALRGFKKTIKQLKDVSSHMANVRAEQARVISSAELTQRNAKREQERAMAIAAKLEALLSEGE